MSRGHYYICCGMVVSVTMKSINGIIETLETKNKKLEQENKKLRRKLGFAYTKINDLRFAKKERDKALAQRR